MMIQIDRTERRSRTRNMLAGFLCLMGLAIVVVTLRGVQPADAGVATASVSEAAQASIHVA